MLPSMTAHKTVALMRHAKSSWKSNEPDIRRPLSGRGTRDAVVAGPVLAALDPGLVWCSPATRARQTWQCAVMGGAPEAELRIADALYGATPSELLATLRSTDESCASVLLIAHEPGLSELIELLAAPSPLVDIAAEKFPTSAIAVLRFPGSFAELSPGSCTIAALEIPRG